MCAISFRVLELRLHRETLTGERIQVRSESAANQESQGEDLRPEQHRKTTEPPHKHHGEDTAPACGEGQCKVDFDIRRWDLPSKKILQLSNVP